MAANMNVKQEKVEQTAVSIANTVDSEIQQNGKDSLQLIKAAIHHSEGDFITELLPEIQAEHEMAEKIGLLLKEMGSHTLKASVAFKLLDMKYSLGKVK